ncbi:dipeptide ABC transporter ATP-binding protein [Bifidobacterium angulatum]|jgi:peptide/nickel transport system ATP-binding protein|uniref:Phosphonate C-P lyase system protein PhnK n=1 Tax=Bifidobacterium angulatum DSM 20098 = JCM 7096 TaxID=518635 RepID=C4FEC8_9BIFI|nr:ABC transporter ATP-binding protein [Bifidobacterium angulatum]EEP21309.1 putative phosphonate C-P lyase system protein PhnK [Bifidobacterium angulatum DSM 20098 = JCM 7096]KFI38865.1 oligopeptide ABC transporter, ATP-binding protein [Bifidobacterium angulatum]MEE0332970.1 ABC transporter ATP-binding protein [Bifidobacterium angulatum]BAQ96212.1 dipeptide ABC transporter ATP-binding component [Bifidobacterium angulatum DSM 20098 = JCM 7096]
MENNESKLVAMQKEQGPLLEVKDLAIDFTTDRNRAVHAVRDVSFSVYPGQWVAIVGESGSGKSTSAMSVLGLLPGTGHVVGGSIKLDGQELVGLKQKDFDKLRGSKMGLVPQDPMSNLNPVWRIGTQVKEALAANNMDISHEKRSKLAKALAGDEVDVKNNDDETFISSAELPALLDAAKAAIAEAGITGEAAERSLAYFKEEWVPGSETRWRVADDLIKAGVKNDTAWDIAKKHVTGSTMDDRIAGLLSEAGLPDAATRARQYPHEFSGGMRQRALIAIGLACRPELLIADEPTSALDVTVQKKILDHLHMLTDSLGTAVLFITHDLGLAAERAQHIVVMYKGQVVESGPSLEVLQHPQHPYTKRLVAAAPSLASQRIISAKEHGENADALLEHHVVGEQKLETSETIITVDHLTKEFKLPRKKEMFKAVDDVSFSVKRGSTLAIVGESGSGKSTVANMVLKLLEPTSGTVTYEGKDISGFKGKELLDFRRHVQPVFQNPYGSLDPMYSIYRSIEEPLRIHGIGDKKSRVKRVRELLDMVELPESVMGRYPNELSGGQRQRIAIARAMALDPDVIVCDEAVSALDVLVQDQVLRLLNDLQAEKGLSYLFITHDLAVVRQIADEVVVMQKGKLVEHATTDEVFDHPKQQYTRDLLDAIPGGKLQLGLD